MGFKENLLQKIRIDNLAGKVIDSIGPPGGGNRIDKEAMKALLEMGRFQSGRERDLELYFLEGDQSGGQILVFDNDLPIYDTSAEDIALRKSPNVKEMVSIRNIKKILNDSDVVKSKKEDSVRSVQKTLIDRLDLSYDRSDIDGMARDGILALDSGDEGGVREALTLFFELLDYRPAPSPFRMDLYEITGKAAEGERGEKLLGPAVIFTPAGLSLKRLGSVIGSLDREKIAYLHKAAKGDAEPDQEGGEVFKALAESVILNHRD